MRVGWKTAPRAHVARQTAGGACLSLFHAPRVSSTWCVYIPVPVACKTNLAGEAGDFQRWTEEHQDQSNRLLKELAVIQVRLQAHLPGEETPDVIYAHIRLYILRRFYSSYFGFWGVSFRLISVTEAFRVITVPTAILRSIV